MRIRLASPGADLRVAKRAYTSPEAKWSGQTTGMSWKVIRARMFVGKGSPRMR